MSVAIDNIFLANRSGNGVVNYRYAPKQGGIAAFFYDIFTKFFGNEDHRHEWSMALALEFAGAIKNELIDNVWHDAFKPNGKLIFEKNDVKVVLEHNSSAGGYDLVRYKKSAYGCFGDRRVYLHMENKSDATYKNLQTSTEFFLDGRVDLFGILIHEYIYDLSYNDKNTDLKISLKDGVKLDISKIQEVDGTVKPVLFGDVICIMLKGKRTYLKCVSDSQDGCQQYKVVEPYNKKEKLFDNGEINKLFKNEGVDIFKTRKNEFIQVSNPSLIQSDVSLGGLIELDINDIKNVKGNVETVYPEDVISIKSGRRTNRKTIYLKCLANINKDKQQYQVVELYPAYKELPPNQIKEKFGSQDFELFKTRENKYVNKLFYGGEYVNLNDISLGKRIKLNSDRIKTSRLIKCENIDPGDVIYIRLNKEWVYLACMTKNTNGYQQYEVIELHKQNVELLDDEIEEQFKSKGIGFFKSKNNTQDILNQDVRNKFAQIPNTKVSEVHKVSEPVAIPTSRRQPLPTRLKNSFEEGMHSFGERLQSFGEEVVEDLVLAPHMIGEIPLGLSDDSPENTMARMNQISTTSASARTDKEIIADNSSAVKVDNAIETANLNATKVDEIDDLSVDEDGELPDSDMVVICGGTGDSASRIEKQYKKWELRKREQFDTSTVFLDGPGITGLNMPTQQAEMQNKVNDKMVELKGERKLKNNVITINGHSRGCFHALALCHYYKKHHPEIKIRLYLTVPVGGPFANSILKYKSIPDNVKVAEVTYAGQTFLGRVGDHSIFFAESIKTKLKMIYMPNESHISLCPRSINYLKTFRVENSGKYMAVKNKELPTSRRDNSLDLYDPVPLSIEEFTRLQREKQVTISSTPTNAPNHRLIIREFYPKSV